MQLPAPRIGLFALVLLSSFICHLAAGIYSLKRIETRDTAMLAEDMLINLSGELSSAVLANDRIGLSLLAAHYAHVPSVQGVAVTDTQGSLLASAGNVDVVFNNVSASPSSLNDMQNSTKKTRAQSKSFTGMYDGVISYDEKPIGKLYLQMTHSTTGELISKFWPLFLTSGLLHLLLWLAYVVIARQRVFQSQLGTTDKPKVVGQKQAQQTQFNTQPTSHDNSGQRQDPIYDFETASTAANPAGSDGLAAHLSSHSSTSRHSNHQSNAHVNPSGDLSLPAARGGMANLVRDKANEGIHSQEPRKGMASFLKALTEHDNPIILQIQFDDPKSLLTRLSPSISKPYYMLCNQLLLQAADALIESHLFEQLLGSHASQNINIVFEPTDFAQDGVQVLVHNLGNQTDHASAAYAAALLAKLYGLIHEVIYTRHREIGRFALLTKSGVSKKSVQQELSHLLEYRGKAGDIMVALTGDALAILKGKVQLTSMSKPSTVLEREVGFVDGFHAQLTSELGDLRDTILSK